MNDFFKEILSLFAKTGANALLKDGKVYDLNETTADGGEVYMQVGDETYKVVDDDDEEDVH